jgi:hypothetical protein
MERVNRADYTHFSQPQRNDLSWSEWRDVRKLGENITEGFKTPFGFTQEVNNEKNKK